MSDVQQGAGWWQASDGRWYPPESTLPPPPAYASVGAKNRSGCAVAALVVGIAILVVMLLAFLSILAITFLGRSTSEKLSNIGGELESAPAFVVRPAS